MKKLLFTLLLVAGGFVAQAQNTINIISFKSEATQGHGNLAYIFDEAQGEKCTDNVIEAADVIIYTLHTDGRLTETRGEGSEVLLVTLSGFGLQALTGAFNTTYNNVHNRNRFGGILQELSTSYTIN